MEMESGLCSKTAEMDSYICMPVLWLWTRDWTTWCSRCHVFVERIL